jgi:GalNAc-alpha-(1->4)-GalNAc-alpha-(1->3)-diNAcBac-PP-undecaprenol alpha-1,4-N-acetyl-D-galactosaminyltransferase
LIKSKNIALYFHSLSNAGGAEKKLCELANELCNSGFNVNLFTLDEVEASSYYYIDKKIVWNKFPATKKFPSFINKLLRIHRYIKEIKKNSITVIIGFVMSGDRTLYIASILSGSKIVVAERNSPIMYHYNLSKYSRYLLWLWMHLSDVIVIQNEIYLKFYPKFLKKKIVIIFNSVNLPVKFANPDLPSPDGRFKILSIQRLDYIQKRPHFLIHAFYEVLKYDMNWDLYLLGNGSKSEKLSTINLIKQLNLENRVFLLNQTLDTDKYFLQSNLFITASLWEGFPNAVAEAMSYGLPIITFGNVIGVSDFVNEAGWVSEDAYNIKNFSKLIYLAMKSPNERVRRGNIGINKMHIYTLERSINSWKNLLNNLYVL